MKTCLINNCTNQVVAKGYCGMHYMRIKRYGNPQTTKKREKCSIEGCDNKHYSKGYCSNHYMRMKRHGDPLYTKDPSLRSLPGYTTWNGMKTRCYNQKCNNYHRYGGRGIIVCGRWRNSFLTFLKDMGPKPFPKACIDRINNDGNYEPDNCRWTTPAENSRNRYDNKLTIEQAEEIRTLYKTNTILQKEIAKLYGVTKATICDVVKQRILRVIF